MNVLVVDDSVVVRRLVSTVLDGDPDISVAATAASGRLALAKLPQVSPDCVVLDVEMPDMDGLQTLRALRKTHPRLPVIMFSALTERGAVVTLDALSAGADDYVAKPSGAGTQAEAMRIVRDELVPRIKTLCRVPLGPPAPADPAPAPVAVLVPARPQPPSGPVDVVVVGASTGGPEALSGLLPQLPAGFPVPVLVVQHMPPVFTRMFAQRLDRSCALSVKEAEDGDQLVPGRILVAAGDHHLEVRRDGTSVLARLTDGPLENFSRPAVDVTFRSVAATYGSGTLALVLTGMGSDGRRGAEAVRWAGGEVVVQDEASSVVWGMPRAVAEAGLAHDVLPLERVAAHLSAAASRGRSGSLVAGAR